ncbi:hypothetical protein L210DRAFT_427098 [Boletus edulis BED1]|uniref:F-box domain-containing protein n=1 Tax=Boletus edulis BED1 TaxID=1328754 RepID=A0AAD4BJW1_BOLED|nr:hypothetical protein L210DRAFT_427098 [Boletus edulis BED1]
MENMTVARVKGEGTRQKSVLSNLHTPWNTHPFIFRLPTEMLEDIFIRCASDYHYKHDGRPIWAAPSWVNVSYVCHHWRHVALNCPTLWTYLFITSRRWREALLARSRQASLKIRGNLLALPDESRWLKMVETVMDHVERIQELRLKLPASYTTHQILSKLSSRAPRLQNLKIMVADSSSEWPSLLFDGDPPALHTLELSDCAVPLSSFKLNALTTLALHDVPVRFRQNIEEFLAALGCMQDLEDLYLYNALNSGTGFLSSAVFEYKNKIELPHLSCLLISAPLSTTVALLSCINFPLDTKTCLTCGLESSSFSDNYALLCSVLTQRYSVDEDQALSSPTILSLVIHVTYGSREVKLTFSESKIDCMDSVNQLWIPNSLLRINLVLEENDANRIIGDICCSMPLSNVQNLLVINPPFSPAFWRRMLGHIQEVRYIKLTSGNMPDLSVLSHTDLTALENEQNRVGVTGDQGQDRVLAPRLEDLVLECITFLSEGDSDQEEPAITRHCLFDALSTRPAQGHLTMTECWMSDSDDGLDLGLVWGECNVRVVYERVHSSEEEDSIDLEDDGSDLEHSDDN